MPQTSIKRFYFWNGIGWVRFRCRFVFAWSSFLLLSLLYGCFFELVRNGRLDVWTGRRRLCGSHQRGAGHGDVRLSLLHARLASGEPRLLHRERLLAQTTPVQQGADSGNGSWLVVAPYLAQSGASYSSPTRILRSVGTLGFSLLLEDGEPLNDVSCWHKCEHWNWICCLNNLNTEVLCVQVTADKAVSTDTVIFEGPPMMEQKLWPKHCVQQTWGAELHPDLKVRSSFTYYFDKKKETENRTKWFSTRKEIRCTWFSSDITNVFDCRETLVLLVSDQYKICIDDLQIASFTHKSVGVIKIVVNKVRH